MHRPDTTAGVANGSDSWARLDPPQYRESAAGRLPRVSQPCTPRRALARLSRCLVPAERVHDRRWFGRRAATAAVPRSGQVACEEARCPSNAPELGRDASQELLNKTAWGRRRLQLLVRQRRQHESPLRPKVAMITAQSADSAATGLTRVARHAGKRLATTITTHNTAAVPKRTARS